MESCWVRAEGGLSGLSYEQSLHIMLLWYDYWLELFVQFKSWLKSHLLSGPKSSPRPSSNPTPPPISTSRAKCTTIVPDKQRELIAPTASTKYFAGQCSPMFPVPAPTSSIIRKGTWSTPTGGCAACVAMRPMGVVSAKGTGWRMQNTREKRLCQVSRSTSGASNVNN